MFLGECVLKICSKFTGEHRSGISIKLESRRIFNSTSFFRNTTTFCLCFAFTGVNFRGMLHHVCYVAYDKNMCGPIRTRKCRSTNWLINYMLVSINVILVYYCRLWTYSHHLFYNVSIVEFQQVNIAGADWVRNCSAGFRIFPNLSSKRR